MNAKQFQLDFFGGPEDGLCVRAIAFPGRTLLVPVGWSESHDLNPADANHPAVRLAQYELTLSRRDVDAENLPIERLRYEFMGVRSQQRLPRLRRFAARLGQMFARPRHEQSTTKVRERIAAWFLAPVDYPLQASPATSPTTSRQVRQSA
jgi:hypothetical protein